MFLCTWLLRCLGIILPIDGQSLSCHRAISRWLIDWFSLTCFDRLTGTEHWPMSTAQLWDRKWFIIHTDLVWDCKCTLRTALDGETRLICYRRTRQGSTIRMYPEKQWCNQNRTTPRTQSLTQHKQIYNLHTDWIMGLTPQRVNFQN